MLQDESETQVSPTDASPVEPAATEPSANSPDVKSTESSPAQDTKPSPLKDSKAAMEILGKDLPEIAPEDKEADESEKSADSKPETGQVKPETEPKDESAEKAQAESAQDAPFHKRSEWLELNKLGEDTAKKVRPILRKVLEREIAVSAQLEKSKPDLDEIKTLKQTVGDGQNWQFFRQVTDGFAKGDPKFIPVLEKMLEQMKVRNGMVVQSPDLKAKLAKLDEAVNSGTITPEDAQERKNDLLEVEKARAGQKMTAAQLEQQRQLEIQRQQESLARSNEDALNQWEANIRSKYTDFGNVTDENDPNHGVSMADQVMSELSARLQVKPPANQQELVAMAQKSLEVVERRMKTYAPQPRQMRPVTSESSSRTAKPAPKSFKEAAENATGILYGSQA